MDYLEVAEALRILGLCRPDSLQKVSREHILSLRHFSSSMNATPCHHRGMGQHTAQNLSRTFPRRKATLFYIAVAYGEIWQQQSWERMMKILFPGRDTVVATRRTGCVHRWQSSPTVSCCSWRLTERMLCLMGIMKIHISHWIWGTGFLLHLPAYSPQAS